MLSGTWARAAWRPVKYVGEADRFEAEPLGWILHVVVGNGSPWGTFERAPAGSRRFSHLWISKTGQIEQYQRLDYESWAQSGGNGKYWSVETEGFPTEPLTDAQLNALAAWHVKSGTVDAVVNRVGARGIGTHVMGGAAWGNHSCPGLIRASQRGEILERARVIRGLAPATPAPSFPLRSNEFYALRARSSHNGYTSSADRNNLRTWQQRMRERGWRLAVDGFFGPETDRVLRQFQAEKGLTADGLLGPESWGAAWILPVA